MDRRQIGIAFLRTTVLPLAKEIGRCQREIRNAGGPIKKRILPLVLQPTTLAILTMQTTFVQVVEGGASGVPTYQGLAVAIGQECFFEWQRRSEKRKGIPDLGGQLAERNKSHMQAARTKKYVDEFRRRALTDEDYLSLGGMLLDCAQRCKFVNIVGEPKEDAPEEQINRVYLATVWQRRLEAARGTVAAGLLVRPHILPLTQPPRAWTAPQGGGFPEPRNPALRTLVKPNPHRPQLEEIREAHAAGRLNPVYDAVNALQQTSWRLNRPVFHLLRRALRDALPLPGLVDWRTLEEARAFLAERGDAVAAVDKRRVDLRKRQRKLEKRAQQAHQASGVRKARRITLDAKGNWRPPRVATLIAAHDPALRVDWLALREEWATYHREASPIRQRQRRQHSLESRQQQIEGLLAVCDQLEAPPRFFYPYQLDFRGRAYPMVSLPSPQGDDLSRAVLEFSEGQRLGEEGERWLAVQLANTAGRDKDALEGRRDWVGRHEWEIRALAGLIGPDGMPDGDQLAIVARELPAARDRNDARARGVAVAASPAGTWANACDIWFEADSPWLFLAGCLEWARRDEANFQTRIPVVLDGTANGLQHLSALTRDRAAAQATNLCESDTREDIYELVANDLSSVVAVEAAGNGPDAVKAGLWVGRIGRKTVKRPVMTTPYGVTPAGLREQIEQHLRERAVDAGEPERLDNTWEAALYLAERMNGAIARAVDGPTKAMGWLKKIAKALARKSLHVGWTSPIGLPVVMDYPKVISVPYSWKDPLTGRRRRATLQVDDRDDAGLDQSAQVNGIAPNFIHSLDAAHMMRTVRRLHGEGIRAFAVIHDSFGVHAPLIPQMVRALQEEFVAMYRTDRDDCPLLLAFLDEQRTIAARLEMLDPAMERELEELRRECPIPGDFDPEEVRRSEYMFS